MLYIQRMKIAYLVILLFFTNLSIYSEENGVILLSFEEFNDIQLELSSLASKIETISEQIQSLRDENIKINNILNQYIALNSNVSNYLTVLSIVLTILAVALPFINIFAVIIPNRKLRKRILNEYRKIPSMVDINFEKYMSNFENRQINEAIDKFVNNDNISELSNYLFLSKTNLNEEQCTSIINKIRSGIEIDNYERIIIFSKLYNDDSYVCTKFFKEIIETENNEILNAYLDKALDFFVQWNIIDNIQYFSKIISSRNDFEEILVALFEKIIDIYIGDPLRGHKSEVNKSKGINIITELFNNELILKAFSKEKVKGRNLRISPIFLDNINTISFYPFIKDTELYKKHYCK